MEAAGRRLLPQRSARILRGMLRRVLLLWASAVGLALVCVTLLGAATDAQTVKPVPHRCPFGNQLYCAPQGYACPVAASASSCPSQPCVVYVAPAPPANRASTAALANAEKLLRDADQRAQRRRAFRRLFSRPHTCVHPPAGQPVSDVSGAALTGR